MSSLDLEYNAIYYYTPPGKLGKVFYKLKYLHDHSEPERDSEGVIIYWRTSQIFLVLDGPQKGIELGLTEEYMRFVYAENAVEVEGEVLITIEDL